MDLEFTEANTQYTNMQENGGIMRKTGLAEKIGRIRTHLKESSTMGPDVALGN
jgi:hypothetical protein